jgi:hypothetical protein
MLPARFGDVAVIPRDEVLDNRPHPGHGCQRRFEQFGEGGISWPVNLGAALGGAALQKPKLDFNGLRLQFEMSINEIQDRIELSGLQRRVNLGP